MQRKPSPVRPLQPVQQVVSRTFAQAAPMRRLQVVPSTFAQAALLRTSQVLECMTFELKFVRTSQLRLLVLLRKSAAWSRSELMRPLASVLCMLGRALPRTLPVVLQPSKQTLPWVLVLTQWRLNRHCKSFGLLVRCTVVLVSHTARQELPRTEAVEVQPRTAAALPRIVALVPRTAEQLRCTEPMPYIG